VGVDGVGGDRIEAFLAGFLLATLNIDLYLSRITCDFLE
jgi:hypothetical protein